MESVSDLGLDASLRRETNVRLAGAAHDLDESPTCHGGDALASSPAGRCLPWHQRASVACVKGACRENSDGEGRASMIDSVPSGLVTGRSVLCHEEARSPDVHTASRYAVVQKRGRRRSSLGNSAAIAAGRPFEAHL